MAKENFSSVIGMNHLTESQKKAVLHKDGPLLVLAGPSKSAMAAACAANRKTIETCFSNPQVIIYNSPV